MNGSQIVLGIIFLAIYFIPVFVAASNDHKNSTGILILNLFLGWTVIGWIGALIWAVTNPTATPAPASASTAEATPATRPCPECAEQILLAARKCKHCGAAVEPLAV